MPGGGEDLQTNARCWEVQTSCGGTEGADSEEEISQAVSYRDPNTGRNREDCFTLTECLESAR